MTMNGKSLSDYVELVDSSQPSSSMPQPAQVTASQIDVHMSAAAFGELRSLQPDGKFDATILPTVLDHGSLVFECPNASKKFLSVLKAWWTLRGRIEKPAGRKDLVCDFIRTHVDGSFIAIHLFSELSGLKLCGEKKMETDNDTSGMTILLSVLDDIEVAFWAGEEEFTIELGFQPDRTSRSRRMYDWKASRHVPELLFASLDSLSNKRDTALKNMLLDMVPKNLMGYSTTERKRKKSSKFASDTAAKEPKTDLPALEAKLSNIAEDFQRWLDCSSDKIVKDHLKLYRSMQVAVKDDDYTTYRAALYELKQTLRVFNVLGGWSYEEAGHGKYMDWKEYRSECGR